MNKYIILAFIIMLISTNFITSQVSYYSGVEHERVEEQKRTNERERLINNEVAKNNQANADFVKHKESVIIKYRDRIKTVYIKNTESNLCDSDGYLSEQKYNLRNYLIKGE
jgi:hypothetical protein